MPRINKLHILALAMAALVLGGTVLYLLYCARREPDRASQPSPVGALSWLPAQAGLVAGIHLSEIRQQQWLLEMVERASGDVRAAHDYQAFVEATGFDYWRDLDRVWLGVFGAGQQSLLTGVAEGRFTRDRILAYARERNAAVGLHNGFEIYQVQRGAESRRQPESTFAFSFLDDTHAAFGSDRERVAMVIDCWLGKDPAVGSDEARRAEFERLAADRQVWMVDNLAVWEPPAFARRKSDPPLKTVVKQFAVGLQISERGAAVTGEARCHTPGQAQQLHDDLTVLLLAGRLALRRKSDQRERALAAALDDLRLTREGNTLLAHLFLPQHSLPALLGVPAATPAAP